MPRLVQSYTIIYYEEMMMIRDKWMMMMMFIKGEWVVLAIFVKRSDNTEIIRGLEETTF